MLSRPLHFMHGISKVGIVVQVSNKLSERLRRVVGIGLKNEDQGNCDLKCLVIEGFPR